MLDIDRIVLRNILSVAPFAEWSPLLHSRASQRRFTDWCAISPEAARIINESLADAPVFESGDRPDEFVLSLGYADTVDMVHRLVSAYEDEALERLCSPWHA